MWGLLKSDPKVVATLLTTTAGSAAVGYSIGGLELTEPAYKRMIEKKVADALARGNARVATEVVEAYAKRTAALSATARIGALVGGIVSLPVDILILMNMAAEQQALLNNEQFELQKFHTGNWKKIRAQADDFNKHPTRAEDLVKGQKYLELTGAWSFFNASERGHSKKLPLQDFVKQIEIIAPHVTECKGKKRIASFGSIVERLAMAAKELNAAEADQQQISSVPDDTSPAH